MIIKLSNKNSRLSPDWYMIKNSNLRWFYIDQPTIIESLYLQTILQALIKHQMVVSCSSIVRKTLNSHSYNKKRTYSQHKVLKIIRWLQKVVRISPNSLSLPQIQLKLHLKNKTSSLVLIGRAILFWIRKRRELWQLRLMTQRTPSISNKRKDSKEKST